MALSLLLVKVSMVAPSLGLCAKHIELLRVYDTPLAVCSPATPHPPLLPYPIPPPTPTTPISLLLIVQLKEVGLGWRGRCGAIWGKLPPLHHPAPILPPLCLISTPFPTQPANVHNRPAPVGPPSKGLSSAPGAQQTVVPIW